MVYNRHYFAKFKYQFIGIWFKHVVILVWRNKDDLVYPFHIDVLGDGSKYAKIAKMIKDLDLSDNITMHGMVHDIENYYRKADVLLVTSLSEGFSLTTLEANCFSLYVVSVDWGEGVHDVIKEGVNGTIVSAYDADVLAEALINSFKNDPFALKRSAYEYAAKFDLANILPLWQRLFEQILPWVLKRSIIFPLVPSLC